MSVKFWLLWLSFLSAHFAVAQNPEAVKSKYPVKIITHRGASGHAPENTIAAFRKAIEMDANYIELDIHLSKDGKVVVMHDATLNRTTNGTGKISDYTWDELKLLDAGSFLDEKFKGEKIPLLEEVLLFTKGKAMLLIEIKADAEGKAYPGIEEKVLSIIKKNEAEAWCEVQSFYDFSVNAWLALNTNIPVHKLLVGRLQPFYIDHKIRFGRVFRKYSEVNGINPYQAFAKRKMIRKTHRKGHTAYVWTVNDENKMQRLIRRKVDGIITNYPEKVVRVIK